MKARSLTLLSTLLLMSCSSPDTTGGLALQKSINNYQEYVNKHSDLLAAFSLNSANLSIVEWGKRHYCRFGFAEGRTHGGVSVTDCGPFTGYIKKYQDLLIAYKGQVGTSTSNQWGKTHYCAFGLSEGRTYSNISRLDCDDDTSTSTTPTTSTTSASTTSTSSTTVSYKSLGPTGTVWKPKSEKDHKLVILTPSSWRAMAISIRQMDGTLIETGSSCKRTNGNRCTYRFGKAGGAYPKPCILRIGTTNYRIADGAQRIN